MPHWEAAPAPLGATDPLEPGRRHPAPTTWQGCQAQGTTTIINPNQNYQQQHCSLAGAQLGYSGYSILVALPRVICRATIHYPLLKLPPLVPLLLPSALTLLQCE